MFKKFVIFTLFCSSSLFAQLTPTLRQTTKFSVRELEDFLKKEGRPKYLLDPKYSIGGQVSGSWKSVSEKLNGLQLATSGGPVSSDQFRINAEIQIAYALGRTFANTRLKFSNLAGAFNGSASDIKLTRAFIGYHFLTWGPHTLDINLGRRALNKIYNSQMMFKSTSDGVTLFGFYVWKNIVEYQAFGGMYISNPGAFWVVRGRLFNIANLGFYFDYDYIFWNKVKPASNPTQNDTRYGVSQFLIGWDRTPEWLGKNLQVFAALLYNNRARRTQLSDNELQNLAGYVGAQIGTVKKQGNFSLQGQLQFCQLQAIPEWDMAGIGRGSGKTGLFKANNISQVNGNTNFKGYKITLNYALSDQITLTTEFEYSVNLSDVIGPPLNYHNYSISSAYSF